MESRLKAEYSTIELATPPPKKNRMCRYNRNNKKVELSNKILDKNGKKRKKKNSQCRSRIDSEHTNEQIR